jgi:hypothetical protein
VRISRYSDAVKDGFLRRVRTLRMASQKTPGAKFKWLVRNSSGCCASMRDRARLHRKGPCRNSLTAVTHIELLGLRSELVKDGFAVPIDPFFIGHHIFHADAAVFADLAVRDRALLKQFYILLPIPRYNRDFRVCSQGFEC